MLTAGAVVFALLFGCWVGYSFRKESGSAKIVDFTDGSTSPLPTLLKRLEKPQPPPLRDDKYGGL